MIKKMGKKKGKSPERKSPRRDSPREDSVQIRCGLKKRPHVDQAMIDEVEEKNRIEKWNEDWRKKNPNRKPAKYDTQETEL